MDLVKILHENELFKSSLEGLNDADKALVSNAAESVVRELSDVLKLVSERPDVVSVETNVIEEPATDAK